MITSTFNTMYYHQTFIRFHARVLYMDTLVIPYNQITDMSIKYTLVSSKLTVTLNKQSYILDLPFNSYLRIHRESLESDFYEVMDNWRFESMWANTEKIINDKQ